MTPDQLARRLARLEAEARAAARLTPAELGELAALEARPRPDIDAMDDVDLDTFLAAGGDPDGTGRRRDELRRRNRTPEQVRADRAHQRMLEAMSLDELNRYLAARTAEAQETPP
jgi:thioesterase domain-containing protein